VLRQVLAQSYFWNGLKDKAVEEYRHIIANHAYLALSDMETRSPQLPLLIDRGYVLSDYFSRIPGMISSGRERFPRRQPCFCRESRPGTRLTPVWSRHESHRPGQRRYGGGRRAPGRPRRGGPAARG